MAGFGAVFGLVGFVGAGVSAAIALFLAAINESIAVLPAALAAFFASDVVADSTAHLVLAFKASVSILN